MFWVISFFNLFILEKWVRVVCFRVLVMFIKIGGWGELRKVEKVFYLYLDEYFCIWVVFLYFDVI